MIISFQLNTRPWTTSGQDLQKEERKEKLGDQKENFCSINRMVALASPLSCMQFVL